MTEPVINPYKLVPVKPTLAMILAATDNCSPVGCCSLEPDHAREIWEAMLAASPQGEGSSAEATPHERLAKALVARDMEAALRLIGEMNEPPAEPQWTKHDGGPNPVPGKTVDLMFAPDNWCRAGLSDAYNWKRGRGAGIDIIAYRVTEGVKP